MEVHIKKLGKFQFAKNYIYEEHSHKEYEINYILSGQCIMALNHKKLALHRGDCAVIEPMVRHNFIVGGTQECHIVQFEFSLNDEIRPVCNEACLKIMNCTDVLDSLGVLFQYNKNSVKSEYYNKLFELEFEKLIVLLSMHLQTSYEMKQYYVVEPLHQIIAYIDCHYDGEIDLEGLAKIHKISARYLRRIFMEYIGFSAMDYITMLRMEKAKDLLKNSSRSISEIAVNVGYNSSQYFSTIFKKKIGITPKEFRGQYTLT